MADRFSFLKDPQFWWVAGVIFLGKLVYWLVLGTSLEPDSIGYLNLEVGIYHPVGYEVVAGSFMKWMGGWWSWKYMNGSTILFQSILFALAMSYGITHLLDSRKTQWIVAGLLALDPATGMLCRSIMSEAFCLSVIVVAIAWVITDSRKKHQSKKQAVLFGVMVGVLLAIGYLIRYSTLLMLPALVVFWVFLYKQQPNWWVKILGMIIGFQVFLLPVRIIYKVRYDTLTLNAFTGYSLWNSAAYLYPESDHSQPLVSQEFDTYLATFPDQAFDMSVTWSTAHIFGAGTPAYDFTHAEKPETNAFHFSKKLQKGALKLILEQPIRHLKEFWVPNLIGIFQKVEQDELEVPLESLVDSPYDQGATTTHLVVYSRHIWQIGFMLLLGLTLMWFLPRFRKRELGLILVFCWGYLFAVNLTAVLFLRFVYFLIPLILLGIGCVAKGLFLPQKPKLPE